MAIPTSQGLVQRYAMGLYGLQLGSNTLNAVLDEVKTNGGITKIDSIFNWYYAVSFGTQSTAEVAGKLAANLGIVTGENGLTAGFVEFATGYIKDVLDAANPNERGAAVSSIISAWENLSGNAEVGAAVAAWQATVDNGLSYAAANTADAPVGTFVTTFNLGVGNDNITGTAGDDLFVSNFSANGNTLESGDNLNGGAGADTLKAIMTSAPFAATPTVSGIEHITVTAQNDTGADSGQNNTSANFAFDAVQLDFGRVSGVETIENFDSRADLIVEDVRIQQDQITSDITIEMRDTDPGAVDFAVYFDQLSLRNVSSSTSLINLRVLDTYAVAQGQDPLKDSPYGSFKFSYTVDGGELQTAELKSDAIQNAKTFPEMVVALQAAADEVFGAGVVTVATGSTYTVPDSVTNTNVQGTELVLSAQGNITFNTSVPGSGWLATDTVPAVSGLYTSYNTDVESSTALVTSTIVLDNVGRGSNGGDLIVGGQSVGDTSNSKGVQRFDITVEDDSKLGTIASTNNTLREVYVENGTTDRSQNAYNPYTKDAGNLTVRETIAIDGNLLPDASNQEQDGFGFTDVRVIDGSAMTGKFDFTAGVTQASIAKYLNLEDTANDPAADNVQFSYTGGQNSDTMAVTIDSAVAGSTGRLSTREDFKFAIDGGAGDDAITVDLFNPSVNSVLAQKQYDNIVVNGGAGNDTIRTPGYADVVINAGAGNDTVYTDNTGARSVWLVSEGSVFPALNDLQTVPANDTNIFLFKGKLTVTYSGATTSGGVTSGAAVARDNGFEVTVDVPTGDNYAVNQYHLNQAIKKAINENAVLNKVLEAVDGPGNTLVINSLVDGAHAANDLRLDVSATAPVAGSADETAMVTGYRAFMHDSSLTAAAANATVTASVTDLNNNEGMGAAGQVLAVAGTDSVNDRDNVIDLGAGSDVLVLSTNAGSVETVKFTADNIGTNAVINFTTGAGGDLLDFNAYLNGKASSSGSTVSQKAIDINLNADATVDANSVTILNSAVFTATDTFAGLTGEKLLAAIQSTNTGSADYAGIVAATLNAANTYTTNTLVGGTGEAVVLVENNLNDGEYAVFKLTFNGLATNTNADFTAATLVGTVDFGNDLAGLAAANLAV